MRLRGGIIGAFCLTVLFALTACVPASVDPSSAPKPSSSATPTPTTNPTEEPPLAASLVVSASGMQVLDDAGATLVEFNYFEPVDAVAAELAVIFETEPTVSPFTGGGDTPPGTNYDWGSILIRDGWPMSEPFYPGYHVFITGNTVGALSISAIGEISIGDDFDAIAAAHPFNDPPLPGYASIDTLDLPDNPDFPGSQLTFSVLVIGDAGGGQVTRMIAPSSNWGA